MGRITVINHVTLDGVMQAPAGPDEDTRDGFADGGWAAAATDEVMGREMGQGLGRPGALLLGRRTYEDFAEVWPKRADNPFTPALNAARKYVVSRTLSETPAWENTILLRGEAADVVAPVREREPAITMLGSGELVQALLAHGLIDAWVLMIHPRVLGRGRRLFADGGAPATLELTRTVTTTTGVIIAFYEAAR